MNNDLVFAFLVLIIIALVITEIDEALVLWILGFGMVALSWNLFDGFSVSSTSYSGFGLILILSYWGLTIFCFAKAGLSGYLNGYSIFKKRSA